MPFLYLFMLASKVQGAHRCHMKKLQKKEKNNNKVNIPKTLALHQV